MSTILFWVAVFILSIILLSMVPGLDLLLKPLIKILFDLLVVVGGGLGNYAIWFLKRLIRAHKVLFTHLTLSAETIDPAYRLEKNSDQHD
ncbi:hypothetical protein A6M27_17085 [Acidithiobacillus thiooxidans]|uniref:hypothetical protein n=1 Tax=Acidithiobacillus thiooxidans TaxID=930 RepID=UPI0004669D37|nr:hypothetical protein [Acidithiobacillus thiooxidans]OCX68473.1 hypothetical protein A6O24_19655 [Acidithiobacillus thiooxidans]OCX83465.1 hypothetical protein A6O26_06975 [Acidithiobacillus thiooxidans]OCX83809.1 hypothetical protein A6M27_17085 [Acidithiobacillus thiooxidans]OFC50295.1 hypothetical protein BAE47_03070 [Acidithiobacillus thiooxidans]